MITRYKGARYRVGYEKHGPVALNWNLWPGQRRIGLYIGRLLFEVILPHRPRQPGDMWKTWTIGTATLTWFDKSAK